MGYQVSTANTTSNCATPTPPSETLLDFQIKEDIAVAGEIKYDIIEEIGVLSENAKGWRKELNLISWNGAAPKYDIRDWAPGHEKMGKGVTLTKEELEALQILITRK